MKVRRTIERAELEIAQGRLWRAKEILQGAIPAAGYDSQLFEKLGTVLLAMHDLPAAGRFLFLSGKRSAEYDQAIGIFLWKYRKNPRALFAAFPRSAKLVARADYPSELQPELKALGFPELLRNPRAAERDDDSVMPAIVGWGIAGSLLVLILLGVIKIFEIWSWLKRR